MPKRSPAIVDERIATLHRAHRTEKDIAAIMGREGFPIDPSGVHRVLQRLGLAAPRKSSKASKPLTGDRVSDSTGSPPPIASADSADPTDDDDDTTDVPERLRRVLASLERVAEVAEADKDVARVVAAQRAITQATALLAKATPAPAPNLDERPDMRAAAQRGRDRIRTLIGRMLGGAK